MLTVAATEIARSHRDWNGRFMMTIVLLNAGRQTPVRGRGHSPAYTTHT
jgi:hypothetical protein